MMTYENNNSFANQDFVTYENLGYFAQKFFEEDLEAVTRKSGNRKARLRAEKLKKERQKALKEFFYFPEELVNDPTVNLHHEDRLGYDNYQILDDYRVNRERQATRHFCSGAWRDEWDNEKAITRQTILSGQIIKFGEDSDGEFCRELEDMISAPDLDLDYGETEEDGLARDYGDPTQATTSLADLMPENINEQIQAFRFAKAIVDNSPENVKEYLRLLLN